jgi:hypothetical protein
VKCERGIGCWVLRSFFQVNRIHLQKVKKSVCLSLATQPSIHPFKLIGPTYRIRCPYFCYLDTLTKSMESSSTSNADSLKPHHSHRHKKGPQKKTLERICTVK